MDASNKREDEGIVRPVRPLIKVKLVKYLGKFDGFVMDVEVSPAAAP
jgi:hypothetical protein